MKTRQASTFPWQVLGYSLHTAQFHCSSAKLPGTCTSASVRLGAKLGKKSIDITRSSLITLSPDTLTPGLRFDWLSTQRRDLV